MFVFLLPLVRSPLAFHFLFHFLTRLLLVSLFTFPFYDLVILLSRLHLF